MSDFYELDPKYLSARVHKQHFKDEVHESHALAVVAKPTQETATHEYLFPIFSDRFGTQGRGDALVILETGICLILETRNERAESVLFARRHKETQKLQIFVDQRWENNTELDRWFLADDIVRAWDEVEIEILDNQLALEHNLSQILRDKQTKPRLSSGDIRSLRALRDTTTIKDISVPKRGHSSTIFLDQLIKPYLQNNDWKADGWPNTPLSKIYNLPLPVDTLPLEPLNITRDITSGTSVSWLQWFEAVQGAELSEIQKFWVTETFTGSGKDPLKALTAVLDSKGCFYRIQTILCAIHNATTFEDKPVTNELFKKRDGMLLFSDQDRSLVTWRHLLSKPAFTCGYHREFSHSVKLSIPGNLNFNEAVAYLCSDDFLTSSPSVWELVASL
jgi:hypothetical protein